MSIGIINKGNALASKPLRQMRPTKRASDVWDSAAFLSIFLASSFSCSRTESTPAHTQVTQTVGRWRSKRINNLSKNKVR